jgi:hypothetical protein
MTTSPLTDQQLTDIDARAKGATPGPWCTDSWEIYQGTEYEPGISQWIGETCRGTSSPEQDRADAEFVAHARTDVPALLAEIRDSRAENEKLIRWHREDEKALAEMRATIERLRKQRKVLLAQIAKKDAETGSGDLALAEFLTADSAEETHVVAEGPDDPEHVDDYPGRQPATPSV